MKSMKTTKPIFIPQFNEWINYIYSDIKNSYNESINKSKNKQKKTK